MYTYITELYTIYNVYTGYTVYAYTTLRYAIVYTYHMSILPAIVNTVTIRINIYKLLLILYYYVLYYNVMSIILH